MTISLFGTASNPADNSVATNASLPLAVTPPASMVAGDLVYVHFFQRSNGTTLSVSNAGGQTWNSEAQHNIGTSACARKFWCVFNGTWSANPSFTSSYTGGTDTVQAVMVVFRPSGTPTWASDVAQATGNSTPGGSPFAVTATGQDPVDAISTVTIASFYNTSISAPGTYALQTAGWTSAGTFRSQSGASTDLAMQIVYRFTTDGAATGNVVTHGTGTVQHNWTIQTFKDQSVSAASAAAAQHYYRSLLVR